MGRKTNEAKTVPLEVTYTEGYQERFTKLILKIYEKRIRENTELGKDKLLPMPQICSATQQAIRVQGEGNY